MSEAESTPRALLAALQKARAAMWPLVKNETGGDSQDDVFRYPKENDLRDAVSVVFDAHGLMEVPGEAIASAGFVSTLWTLYHLPSGESLPLRITWPLLDHGKFTRAHTAAATWSHAWRHLMCKLLSVKTVDKVPDPGAAPPASTPPRNLVPSAELDREVGEMPLWAAEPTAKPRVPVDTSPGAQWTAAGAIVEPPPAPIFAEVLDVWAAVCAHARLRNVPKPWDSALAAWKVFAGLGHERDALAPNDDAFKRWLLAETGATLS